MSADQTLSLKEWALGYMDPLNEVLFDMHDDGGHPVDIACILLTRATAELALHGTTRGEAEVLLWGMLREAMNGVYAAQPRVAEGMG